MKTGYQIYCKRNGENTYHECGLNNWFWRESDAIERCNILNKDWKNFGNEYIVIFLG